MYIFLFSRFLKMKPRVMLWPSSASVFLLFLAVCLTGADPEARRGGSRGRGAGRGPGPAYTRGSGGGGKDLRTEVKESMAREGKREFRENPDLFVGNTRCKGYN